MAKKKVRAAKKKAHTAKKKPTPPAIRDRIVGLRRIRAADLVPHPRNYRIHGQEQRRAMEGVLNELGYADALVARELDGTVQVLDGHLRAEITPDQEVPVLIIDLDDAEAELLLATHDQLTGMAELDLDLQLDLLNSVEPDDAELRRYLADVTTLAGVEIGVADGDDGGERSQGSGPGPGPAEMPLLPHEHYDYVIVLARTIHEWNRLVELIGIQTLPSERGALGIGRGISASKLIELLENGNLPNRSTEPQADS